MKGGYGKLMFFITGEAYVIIIVASLPLMNSLIKWRRRRLGREQKTYGSSNYMVSQQVSVKKGWVVEYETPVSGKFDYQGMRHPV
jgi:hypothetical protein